MKFGLNIRVGLIIYALVAVMLSLSLAPIVSCLRMRSAIDEVRRELFLMLQLRRFDLQAVRQSVEYFDVAFLRANGEDLEEAARGGRTTLDLLQHMDGPRRDPERLERVRGAYARLSAAGERVIELAHRGEHDQATELFKETIVPIRDAELLPLVDSALIEGTVDLGAALDRLLAASAQLAFVPLVGVESDAGHLRALADEAIAAARFSRQTQRFWGEYRDFAFFGKRGDALIIAEGKSDYSFQVWQARAAANGTGHGPIRGPQMREIGARYRDLKQTSKKLLEVATGGEQSEVIRVYESEFEPMAEHYLPQLLGATFNAYDARIEALLEAISFRSGVAGAVIGLAGLLVLGLALGSPWMMSRWIIRPVLDITRTARKLGAGEISDPISVRTGGEIAELAATFNRMSEQLRERTRELEAERAREKLHHAERLASVGTLAAGIAHQINNPVNNILLTAEQALYEDGPEAPGMCREALLASAEEARRCAEIVRSLVAFSRGEPSRKWAEDANQMLCRAHDLTAAEAEERGTALELRLSRAAVPIRANPIALEQALVNILRNAIESGPRTRVVLSAERLSEAVRIEVEDDGRGIGPEDVKHLFDPFYTTRSEEGGTGLGLSVAHGIVVDHGGTVSVDGRPGEGTTVTIELPLDPSLDDSP